VLVCVRPVREGTLEQLGIDIDAEPISEDGRVGRRLGARPHRRQTASTCLPSYCPQFEQAVCGSFNWPQARFGHGTNVGALVFQCDRRERVLLREVLRLGTATVIYS